MLHSFVIARILPQHSARWTSYYGVEKAKSLVTRPFLALRVRIAAIDGMKEFPNNPMHGNHIMFIVSPEKPTGVHKNCYWTIATTANTEKRILAAHPPYPSQGQTLYIHTSPKLLEQPEADDEPVETPTLPHRLEESSFRAFCRSIVEDNSRRMRLQRLEAIRLSSSGDAHLVKDKWDTWSGQSDREYMHRPSETAQFEHLPCKTLPLEYSSSSYDEIMAYTQFTSDYSWPGVTSTISWVEKLRDYQKAQNLPHVPLLDTHPTWIGSVLSSGSERELRANASTLQSIKIPFDGDPKPVVDESEKPKTYWDDDDEPRIPTFKDVPNAMPSVPALNVKTIVFDLFGSIFDRETAIKNAMHSVTQFNKDNLSSRRLLEFYTECESLRTKEEPDAAYIDVARSALKDVGVRLGISISDIMLDEGLEHLLRPRVYSDVIPAIKTLRTHGYTVLGLSSLDSRTFSRYIQPHVPDDLTVLHPSKSVSLHSQDPHLFPEILDYCRSKDGGITPSQILVVTSAKWRIVEPATAAGFPTVLVQRTDSLQCSVKVDSAAPTLTTDTLTHLCKVLENSSDLSPQSQATGPSPFKIPPFRIHGLYQVKDIMGFGSFGDVWAAFHVTSGELVAVKTEITTGKPDQICVLPYEAQIYRQLHGHQGIPAVHWFGVDGAAHVLVLDRLGPNLQELRRFCRGQLSLKTVLMVAEQMLTRVEFAHSRGIILRDIKPENFAVGLGDRSNLIHMFDFGLAKLYVNPVTDEHIPFREGRDGLGTPRYASHNIHFGREISCRDDMESLGNVLLFLLHGKLPWQGIFSPSVEAKLLRIGEMKAGPAFQDLLERSPPEFTRYFDHCRALAFHETPDYLLLKKIFRQRMEQEGWDYDSMFDWADGSSLEKGTLMIDEYKFDSRFVDPTIIVKANW